MDLPETPTVPMRLMGERFVISRKLGSGAFGQAFLVTDSRTSQQYVVKRLKERPQTTADLTQARTEIENLSRIRHENIVRFYRAWFDVDRRLHMLFDYCDGGDLEQHINSAWPLSESTLKCFMEQLLRGLDCIHGCRMLHRDIKLPNVFISRSVVDGGLVLKIGDFGLSKSLRQTDEAARTQAGTPLYFSPELASHRDYTRKADVWAMGVLFFCLVAKQFPFQGKTVTEVLQQIAREKPPDPRDIVARINPSVQYTDGIYEITRQMLRRDPSERPTAGDLLQRFFRSAVPPTIATVVLQGGGRTMIVSRENVSVNIRSKPARSSARLGSLLAGDEVNVEHGVEGDEAELWYHISKPVIGYVVALHDGQPLFREKVRQVAPATPSTPTFHQVAIRERASPLRRPSPPAKPRTPEGPRKSPIHRLSPLRKG